MSDATPPETPEPPPSPDPGETPYVPPTSPAGSNELHPLVPALVSFFAPGLGLLLLRTRDRVKDALLIFGGYFVYVSIATILLAFIVGVCCWIPVPLINIAAAIHSYDEAILLEGGSPLIFKKGLRLFKE